MALYSRSGSMRGSRFWMIDDHHRIDSRFLQYVVSVIFLLVILVFSLVQIVNDTAEKQLYLNIMSTLFGIMLPRPSIPHSQVQKRRLVDTTDVGSSVESVSNSDSDEKKVEVTRV